MKMEKKQVELIITGAAILIFIVLLVNTFTKSKRPSPPPTPVSRPAPEEVEPTLARRVKPELEKKRELDWRRDPFGLEKIIVEGEEAIQLILKGIIWDEEKPFAIINEVVVNKGDKIEGNTVIEIKRDSVILSNGLKKFTLKIWQ